MKKKILVLTAVLSLACAANSFAAAIAWLVTGTATTSGGSQAITGMAATAPAFSFKNSAGVVTGYAKQTNGPSYTVAAYHISGSFAYATSSVDTSIYRKENTAAGGNSTQANVTALGIPDAPADANAAAAMGALWTQNAWTASK